MTWGELRELHASGLVDVESHTYESRYRARMAGHRFRSMALRPISRRGSVMRRCHCSRTCGWPRLGSRSSFRGKVVKHLAFPAYDGTSVGIEAAKQCGYEACYWGLLAGRPVNRLGASPLHVARLSHEYLRRLPGDRRDTLVNLALSRARIVRSGWARPST